jgi:hypothetical protein
MSVNTTRTPPPSRLQGHSFGQAPEDTTPAPSDPYPLRPPVRLNGRIPPAAVAPPQTMPPSRLQGFSFGQAPEDTMPPSRLQGFSFSGPATPPKKRRWGLIGLVLFMVLSLGAGTFMVIEGSRPVVQDAPLPDKPDNIAPADQKPVGADGVETTPAAGTPAPGTPAAAAAGAPGGANSGAVPVENADTGGGEAGWSSPRNAVPVTLMSTTLMEPMSVFVPQAKMYSLARPSDAFVQSKYAGLDSITIPDNPHRTVWYSDGGAMASTNADGSAATSGTTFLGSHSGYAGLWGAYVHMAYLKGGETVWTKDAQGHLQRWQVDRVRYMPHTSFPQEFWTAKGPRRLVMTTCGGTVGADGIYNENVFIEAKPVNTDGSAL